MFVNVCMCAESITCRKQTIHSRCCSFYVCLSACLCVIVYVCMCAESITCRQQTRDGDDTQSLCSFYVCLSACLCVIMFVYVCMCAESETGRKQTRDGRRYTVAAAVPRSRAVPVLPDLTTGQPVPFVPVLPQHRSACLTVNNVQHITLSLFLMMNSVAYRGFLARMVY